MTRAPSWGLFLEARVGQIGRTANLERTATLKASYRDVASPSNRRIPRLNESVTTLKATAARIDNGHDEYAWFRFAQMTRAPSWGPFHLEARVGIEPAYTALQAAA